MHLNSSLCLTTSTIVIVIVDFVAAAAVHVLMFIRNVKMYDCYYLTYY